MLNSKLYLGDTLISKPSKDTISITENGLVDVSDYASAEVYINNIISSNDVTYYDYDGKVVASYSKEEFANLSVEPSIPVHEGLIAQGWSWSLNDAKEFVSEYGHLDIGPYYITDDGATRLYLDVRLNNFVITLTYLQTKAGDVTINWGDGTSYNNSEIVNNAIEISHTYSNVGKYVLTMQSTEKYQLASNATSGNKKLLGNSSLQQKSLYKVELGANISKFGYKCFEDSCIESITIPKYGENDEVAFLNDTFRNVYFLKFIVISPNFIFSGSEATFQNAYNLETVAFPKENFVFSTNAFGNNYSLKSCVFNSTVAYGRIFSGTYSLRYVKGDKKMFPIASAYADCCSVKKFLGGIPEGTTSIGASCFSGCKALEELTIPSSVTSIGANAFTNCYSLLEMDVEGATPPSLGANAFNGCNIQSIYVPDDSVNEYKGATNWQSLNENIIKRKSDKNDN